jgi:hypothetical protein
MQTIGRDIDALVIRTGEASVAVSRPASHLKIE